MNKPRALTLRLPEDVWEKLKILAVKQRKPMTALLIEAVTEYIKAKRHKEAA